MIYFVIISKHPRRALLDIEIPIESDANPGEGQAVPEQEVKNEVDRKLEFDPETPWEIQDPALFRIVSEVCSFILCCIDIHKKRL